MKKIELKVVMHCTKCRTQVFKEVAKVSGVNQISVDLDKERVTIIGDVDPVLVASKLRKSGKRTEIVSVGAAKEGT